MSSELLGACTWSMHWNEKSPSVCGILLKCTNSYSYFILLSSACESSILVDPNMLRLNSIVGKAALVWNKLSRYQHHCTFLKLCLARNVIPVGFNFRFHLALNIDNVNLNTFCKHSLQRTSRDICNAVLLASQEKVNLLQQELRLHREQLFSRLSYDSAFFSMEWP